MYNRISNSISINCYRAINSVRLQLAPLTILTGRNNSGKSSLLEALALAFSAPKLTNWRGEDILEEIINDRLGGLPARLANTACNNRVATITLRLGGYQLVGTARSYITIKTSAQGWMVFTRFRRTSTHPLEALHDAIKRIHSLTLLGEYNRVIGSLGLRDPVLREGEVYFLQEGDGLGERVPASLLGDGTLHLLLLHAGAVLAQREPRVVLLLEEPETGLHPGYMIGLADQLVRAAGANTGAFIVLSTHSMEMIHFIARRAAKHGLSDRVKTVLMKDGDVYAEFRGSEVLEAQEIGAELRGV